MEGIVVIDGKLMRLRDVRYACDGFVWCLAAMDARGDASALRKKCQRFTREVAARQALLRLVCSGHDSCYQSSRLRLQASLSLLSFPTVLVSISFAAAVLSAFHVASSVSKFRRFFLRIHFSPEHALLVSRIEQDAHKNSAIGAAVVLCAAGTRCRGLLQGMGTPHSLVPYIYRDCYILKLQCH